MSQHVSSSVASTDHNASSSSSSSTSSSSSLSSSSSAWNTPAGPNTNRRVSSRHPDESDDDGEVDEDLQKTSANNQRKTAGEKAKVDSFLGTLLKGKTRDQFILQQLAEVDKIIKQLEASHPPLGSTVASVDMFDLSGSVLRCFFNGVQLGLLPKLHQDSDIGFNQLRHLCLAALLSVKTIQHASHLMLPYYVAEAVNVSSAEFTPEEEKALIDASVNASIAELFIDEKPLGGSCEAKLLSFISGGRIKIEVFQFDTRQERVSDEHVELSFAGEFSGNHLFKKPDDTAYTCEVVISLFHCSSGSKMVSNSPMKADLKPAGAYSFPLKTQKKSRHHGTSRRQTRNHFQLIRYYFTNDHTHVHNCRRGTQPLTQALQETITQAVANRYPPAPSAAAAAATN